MRPRRAGNKLASDIRICRYQRSGQAAFTGAGQSHGVVRVTIRHQRSDRTKGFRRVNGRGLVRLRTEEQRRREECARSV
ncbi:hypothetical protein D3C81_1840010 [compost metagenome]